MFTSTELAVIRQAQSILQGKLLTENCFESPVEVKQFCQVAISHYEHEVFGVLFLNQRHFLIEFVEMFRGTVGAAAVYPREVAKKALELNAAAVILTHNHPSGVTEPSGADKKITQKLSDVLSIFDIRTLDHVVVGVGGSFSFTENGLL